MAASRSSTAAFMPWTDCLALSSRSARSSRSCVRLVGLRLGFLTGAFGFRQFLIDFLQPRLGGGQRVRGSLSLGLELFRHRVAFLDRFRRQVERRRARLVELCASTFERRHRRALGIVARGARAGGISGVHQLVLQRRPRRRQLGDHVALSREIGLDRDSASALLLELVVQFLDLTLVSGAGVERGVQFALHLLELASRFRRGLLFGRQRRANTIQLRAQLPGGRLFVVERQLRFGELFVQSAGGCLTVAELALQALDLRVARSELVAQRVCGRDAGVEIGTQPIGQHASGIELSAGFDHGRLGLRARPRLRVE